MSIGETLAIARERAGLSVGEVSARTRVTEPIIRGIEHDDYVACGGDFYARGHIRAIARALGEDPMPLIDEFDSRWRSEKDLTAAEAFAPSMPLKARTRERRRVRWSAALAVAVLIVLGFACYKFVSGAGGSSKATAGAAAASHHPKQPASAPAVAVSSAASSASQSASASPSPTPAPPAPKVLAAASVAAFGPGGVADGDNPQLASLAVSGNAATPWYSDWYQTPDFSNLQAGTGLLLDMGHDVTVSSVRVALTGETGTGGSGADLQLRAGGTASPGSLREVATARHAGGTVQLRPGAQVRARYLLVWFTTLPADTSGTYQVRVYKITVEGQP